MTQEEQAHLLAEEDQMTNWAGRTRQHEEEKHALKERKKTRKMKKAKCNPIKNATSWLRSTTYLSVGVGNKN